MPTRQPFALLESKLTIPASRSGSVVRARFLDRLAQRAGDAVVVSVAAPAGSGKTTALAQWAARRGRPVAWVSLDRHDNDPVLLLGYLAAALEQAHGIEARIFDSRARAAAASVWGSALPRLCRATASYASPLEIVLDDVHELTDRDCLDILVAVARSLGPQGRLVLAGRASARIPLARMRVRGELAELGADDLAFDDREALMLLRQAGAQADGTAARELNRRTEGWAAGLYLAALATRDERGDPVRWLAGSDRLVTDFLRAELLAAMPPRQVRFLTRTSVLERLSGPLCDAVLERSDSARTLASLARANAFVVPLDRREEWYRYHHLFREMLAAELRQREPGTAEGLHRRAAAWLETHGQPEAAVEHALAAGDLDTGRRLLEQLAFPLYRAGRAATVRRWLSAFDRPELLERYPAIAVLGTYMHALSGDSVDAERWADVVERSSATGPMPDGSPFPAWQAATRALLARRGVEQLRADAGTALAELSESSPFRAPALLFAGVGALLCGDQEAARELFVETAELATAVGAKYAGVVALSELVLLALAADRPAEADAELERAWALATDAPLGEYVPVALLLAANARLAARRGESERARGLLASVQPLRPLLTHSTAWFSVQTQLELVRAHIALADIDGARVLLREAKKVTRLRPQIGVLEQQLAEVAAQLTTFEGPTAGWAATLTTAELRLLPLLTTHLTFREIGERLYISRNTVKTQAISVYRKLGASSRSEALERAQELGLIDPPLVRS